MITMRACPRCDGTVMNGHASNEPSGLTCDNCGWIRYFDPYTKMLDDAPLGMQPAWEPDEGRQEMTLTTSPGFWRSFDRDHEPLVQTEPTSQSTHTITGHCTCQTCGMPCHLEMHTVEYELTEIVFDRKMQTIWVARHGPAPYSQKVWSQALRGTTPEIELPDATVMVDPSQGKRHLPVQGTQERIHDLMTVANLLCGTLAEKYRVHKLGECWSADVCKLCKENPSQI